MNDNYETSKVLKSFRARKGLTIEEASSQINWHFNTYSRKENNPLKCSFEELGIMTKNLEGDFNVLYNALIQDFKSYCDKNK